MKALLITTLLLLFSQTAFAYTETDIALLLYTQKGDNQRVAQLLRQEADPNVTNTETDFSALMAAASFSDPTLTRQLLDAGANVNKRNKKNESALFYAIRGENPKVVKTLLKYGADIQIRNSLGLTPMDVAKKIENTEIMSLLQNSANSFTMNTLPEIPTETSFSTIDESVLEQIVDELSKMDKEKLSHADKKRSYHLTEKKFYQYNNSKFSLSLITPYSLTYYNYAVAMQNDDLPYESTIKEIMAHKDIAWLWAVPDPARHIEKVTVRAGGVEYHALARTGYIPQKAFSNTKIPRDELWAFPAAIFSEQNKITEILVYRTGKKIDIIQIHSKSFSKIPIK